MESWLLDCNNWHVDEADKDHLQAFIEQATWLHDCPKHDVKLAWYDGSFALADSENIKQKPITVLWNNADFQARIARATLKGEGLLRAIGLKGNKPLSVLDVTAGLGGDSFLMASKGADVTMVERNPLVFSLLLSAYQTRQHPEKMREPIQAVSHDYIALHNHKYDVIYMDPMFAHKKKSVGHRKEMMLLQKVAGPDEDAPQLLNAALQQEIGRVVVKLPANNLTLGDKPPSYSIKDGSSCRFDVYIR